MKRLLYILSAILVISGCGKTDGNDKPDLKSQLCGDWQSTTLSVSGKVYLSFNGAGTFEMYQMIGEGAYRLYRGTWNLEEDILTGKYNDAKLSFVASSGKVVIGGMEHPHMQPTYYLIVRNDF